MISIEGIRNGKAIKTRDGRNAKFISYDENKIFGLCVDIEGYGLVLYPITGQYTGVWDHDMDLVQQQ